MQPCNAVTVHAAYHLRNEFALSYIEEIKRDMVGMEKRTWAGMGGKWTWVRSECERL